LITVERPTAGLAAPALEAWASACTAGLERPTPRHVVARESRAPNRPATSLLRLHCALIV
jgi:hypothetical protein